MRSCLIGRFVVCYDTGLKKRPAVIVSSADYHAQRRNVVIMSITSPQKPQ